MLELLKSCSLCPRKCAVNRLAGEVGYCHTNAGLIVARAALHFWEEPCISGDAGSGTVFFSGCSLGCVYCQNQNISSADAGKEISVARLADIFLELEQKGALNINLVTPTHYVIHIIKALQLAKGKGLKLPVVYNSSGYESVKTLRLLDGMIDVYLPDFKYHSSTTARLYSHAENYPEIAKAAISEMFRQTGKILFSDSGIVQKGTIVRHLVLPGHIADAKKIIQYLFDTYKNDIFISIMNQYTPMPAVKNLPLLCRTLTPDEYDEVIDFALSIGVENAYVQDENTASESFIPEFNLEGV